MVVFGGQASPAEVLCDAHALSPGDGGGVDGDAAAGGAAGCGGWAAPRWRAVGGGVRSRPPPRFNHSASEAQGALWVVGGRGARGGFLSDCWELDCAEWVWRQVWLHGPPLPPIAGHVAAVVHGAIVVFGGTGGQRGPYGGVLSLLPSSAAGAGRAHAVPWRDLPGRAPPSGRRGAAAVACPAADLGLLEDAAHGGTAVVCFGGDAGGGALGDLCAFALSAGGEIPPLPLHL